LLLLVTITAYILFTGGEERLWRKWISLSHYFMVPQAARAAVAFRNDDMKRMLWEKNIDQDMTILRLLFPVAGFPTTEWRISVPTN